MLAYRFRIPAPSPLCPRFAVARIFFALALFSLVLLLANMAIGFSIGDLNTSAHRYIEAQQRVRSLERRKASADDVQSARTELQAASQAFQPVRQRYSLHSLCGIAAALVTVLVNSVAVTYFVGTSKWCREVVEAYRLDPQLAQASQRLKRRTFPWAVAGMLTMIVLVALGAASDPVANFENGGQWVTIHMMCALLGTGLIAYSFLVQVGNIGANYDVIERILQLVAQHRTDTAPPPAAVGPSGEDQITE